LTFADGAWKPADEFHQKKLAEQTAAKPNP
jgi:hypothetical protein